MSDEGGLTLAQQTRALWTDEQQHVHAVILGARMPGLQERLASAEVDDWDVLWAGELEPAERAAAPHLVALIEASDFTRWLASEATAGYGGWGVFLLSQHPFLVVRSQARGLCQARLPDGSELRLDWADPPVLQALLPLASPEQLAGVFSTLEAIVIPGARQWTRMSLSMGALQVQRRGVLPAG